MRSPAPRSSSDRRTSPRPRRRTSTFELDFGQVSDDLLSRGYDERWQVSDGHAGGVAGRRTVTIRGQGAERSPVPRNGRDRRPVDRRHERAGFQPDRAAMWAVMMGVMLLLVAVTSAHA